MYEKGLLGEQAKCASWPKQVAEQGCRWQHGDCTGIWREGQDQAGAALLGHEGDPSTIGLLCFHPWQEDGVNVKQNPVGASWNVLQTPSPCQGCKQFAELELAPESNTGGGKDGPAKHIAWEHLC
jgi:hypothetical protein